MTIGDSIKQLREIVELYKRGFKITLNATDIKAIELLIKEVSNDKMCKNRM